MEKEYWLDKKENVKKLLKWFYALCVVLFLMDLLFLTDLADKHAWHEWENWIGFYPIFGFVEFVLLVLFAKYVLRPLIRRKEDYYDR
jgi:hypothetical protein